MLQDNPLLAQLKKQMEESLVKVSGRVKATERKYGFLETEDKESYFIPPQFMNKLMHGDKIVGIIRKENDKEFIEPCELMETNFNRFVARVKVVDGYTKVIPDHPIAKKMISARTVKGISLKSLKDGDWVLCTMSCHPLQENDDTKRHFKASIVEKISDADDKVTPWFVTLAHHDLPKEEPQPHNNAEFVESEAKLSEIRRDLTDMPFFTIDGASTRDMDDALHIEKTEAGFKLTVAIADPTAYIDHGSDMDVEAKKRAFTTYLPARNIPMLPRNLSDELCSLVEGEERPVVVCELNVDESGVIADDYKFSVAFIKSAARLVYDEVSDVLEGVETEVSYDEGINSQLQVLAQFQAARSDWREKNAITFKDTVDYRFEIDSDNEVVTIHLDERRIANRMVEEAMIAANECCGRALAGAFEAGVFNTHDGMAERHIDKAMDVIGEFNAPFTKEQIKELEGFAALRRWGNEQPTQFFDYRIRKFQAFTDVLNKPSAHFAMGLPLYATWTSPIRKYGDMVNHRLLKAMILGETDVDHLKPSEELCKLITDEKVKHKRASRTIADWLYTRMLKGTEGEPKVYNAEIFDISRGGMRVRLLDLGASAFIPARTILDDKKRLVCDGAKGCVQIDGVTLYKLGDSIDVELTQVDTESRKLDAKVAA